MNTPRSEVEREGAPGSMAIWLEERIKGSRGVIAESLSSSSIAGEVFERRFSGGIAVDMGQVVCRAMCDM